MGKVANKRAYRNRQKQARRMNRINQRRKQKKRPSRLLTIQQKIVRKEQLRRREEAKQKRKQLIEKQEESRKVRRIRKALSSIFSEDGLDQLARDVGFIKRKGIITAFGFVYTLSFGFLGDGGTALTYLVAGLKNLFNIDVTTQALSKRINTKSSTVFLKATLEKLVETQLMIGIKNRYSEMFSMFSGILLEDSTEVTLNEELSEDFKGKGGAGSKSALKIQCTLDIMTNLMHGLKITSGIVPDQATAQNILEYIKPKSLVIRDLGYFFMLALRKIEKAKAYYLSRLSISINVYLNKDDIEPLNLLDFLKIKIFEGHSSISIPIYIGQKERLKTRLVAEKVPPEVSEKRKLRFKKENKKSPSQYYQYWCGYSIFITNIPESMFSGKMIIALYKIRWQIELVFLNLKSNVEIDILKGSNKYRIEGLVYGRLITLVTIYIVHNYATYLAKNREVSEIKLTKWLTSDGRLHRAIREQSTFQLFILLKCDLMLVCKQQRKRKTTQEMLKESLRLEQNNIMEEEDSSMPEKYNLQKTTLTEVLERLL